MEEQKEQHATLVKDHGKLKTRLEPITTRTQAFSTEIQNLADKDRRARLQIDTVQELIEQLRFEGSSPVALRPKA